VTRRHDGFFRPDENFGRLEGRKASHRPCRRKGSEFRDIICLKTHSLHVSIANLNGLFVVTHPQCIVLGKDSMWSR